VEVKEHPIKISNIFASLENLDEDMDIDRAWEIIRENIPHRSFSHRKTRLLTV
jgi:hypothetical protein